MTKKRRKIFMIPIAKPFMGEEEKQAVVRVLESGMIAAGAVVDEFNQKFADYVGVKHGIACSSGTTALEVALRALGIGEGDKVLTTPFSFIASTNCILYVGATPVFADINPTTFNICPDLMEKELQKDPSIKAMLIVHLFGHTCDMDKIMALKQKYNLILIEDCAQSHGTTYKGKMAGSFGEVSCFSFYPTKNMTTSEGGMITTNCDKIAEKSRLLISHGMKIRYYHDIIGYNYRMTNIAAAIGIEQLKKLDGFNAARNKTAKYYNDNIKNPLITLPSTYEGCYHSFHQYSILVSQGRRDDFLAHLQTNQIGHGVFYPISIPEQDCYKSFGWNTSYPATDAVKEQILSIPVHPQLTDDDIKRVVQVINDFK
jgi:perosamine synthetase